MKRLLKLELRGLVSFSRLWRHPESLMATGLVRTLIMMGDTEVPVKLSIIWERMAASLRSNALAAVQLAERAGKTASEIQPLRLKLAAQPDDLQVHQI